MGILKLRLGKSRLFSCAVMVREDSKALYDRSPINFLDKMLCPIILFQGLEDKVTVLVIFFHGLVLENGQI